MEATPVYSKYCNQCKRNYNTERDICPECAYPFAQTGNQVEALSVSTPMPGLAVLAWWIAGAGMMLAAVGFIWIWLQKDENYADVNDLFDVMYSTGRGLAFLCAGGVVMIFACLFMLYSMLKK